MGQCDFDSQLAQLNLSRNKNLSSVAENCDHLPHTQDLFGDDDGGDNTTVMVTKVFCPGMENSLSDVRKIQKRTGKAFLSSMII